MIDAEIAAEATPLLSTVLAVLVEDQQDAMLRGFGGDEAETLAADLVALGQDFTIVARALSVILRRARPVEEGGR